MKQYLVCIDSDGCAVDSMEIKHRRCFGPYIVDVWHLEPWKEDILTRWNHINLYSMTRGINRFLGLEKMLSEVDAAYCRIDGLSDYSKWCRETSTYSNTEIQKQIEQGAHPIFGKVLAWSNYVNSGIEKISKEIKPFEGVKDAMEAIKMRSDIAIVSSANPEAVQDEWTRFALLNFVDYVMAQDAGTKADCIAKMRNCGYAADHILMIGDAPGDQQAAEKNGVLYYPILAGKETLSWRKLVEESYAKFCDGTYSGAYQEELVASFFKNLVG
ncbi:MAG: HAD family hydrolase [Faecousia sp.]